MIIWWPLLTKFRPSDVTKGFHTRQNLTRFDSEFLNFQFNRIGQLACYHYQNTVVNKFMKKKNALPIGLFQTWENSLMFLGNR